MYKINPYYARRLNNILLLLLLMSSSLLAQVTVSVDKTKQYQKIEGFGAFGGMTDPWNSPPWYNSTFIDRVVNDMGLTIVRTEVPNQFEMVNDNNDPFNLNLSGFNLTQQASDGCKGSHQPLQPWLDYLKAIKTEADAKGEPLKVIASIWSPPYWMKYVKCIFGGDWNWNRLIVSEIPSAEVPNDYKDEFAEYCVAYIKIVKQQTGIDIYAISLQNEPNFAQGYQSAVYTSEMFKNIVKHVGKRFEQEGINVKIFGPEDVVANFESTQAYMNAIYEDPEAQKQLDVFAIHGYGSNGVDVNNTNEAEWRKTYDLARRGNYPMWMTETSGYSTDWSGALNLAQSILGGLKYGRLSAWVYWSLSGTEDSQYNLMYNGNPTKRYYTSKQFYRYIRPGAIMVGNTSTDPDLLSVSFLHRENKTLTTVLVNIGSSSKTVTLNYTGGNIPAQFAVYRTSETENSAALGNVSSTASLTIPAKSVVTLIGTSGTTDAGLAPSFVLQPSNTTVSEGASVTFSAEATGTPDLVYQWKKNGTNIPGANGLTYTIKSTSLGDNNALYTVTVSNAFGSVTSAQATLTVTSFSGLAIAQTSTAPSIDGNEDAAWANAQSYDLSKKVIGTPAASDFSGKAKVMWDNANLYFYITITDDQPIRRDATGSRDAVEIFLDMDNSKNSAYGADDYQFAFRYDTTVVVETKHNAIANVTYKNKIITGGYITEVKIPFATVGVTPVSNRIIGIDIAADDADGSGRESKISYNTTSNDIWFNPSYMGTGQLKGGGSNPDPNPGTGTGLAAEYFNNKTLTAPTVLTRTDATVNFDWASGSPAPGTVTVDNFSVRWTGKVEAPVTGDYTFSTISDDGVRLWVNGIQVINNWTDHAPTTNNSSAISLTAGQKYDVKMEFYESGGGAQAKLLWTYPGQTQQAIPTARLYPATGTSTPTSTYLSDMTWTSATNGHGPVEKDKSNGESAGSDGTTITLNGTTYAKGLGVHSTSTIVYNLGGNYSSFISDVGVDDEVGTNGAVVFEVYLDGTLAYSSGVMNGSTATKNINISVAGKNELKLVITDGGDGPAYDHADWAGARVTGSSSARKSFETPSSAAGLNIYPNPVNSNTLNISLYSDREQIAQLELVGLSGRQSLVREKKQLNAGVNQISLSIPQVKNGIYLLIIQKGLERITRKVVVAK